MAPNPPVQRKLIAQNRKARFNYFIEDTFEAGIVLTGSEVKSLREGKGNIEDAYADEKDGQVWLLNSYIAEYKGANRFNHESRRPRKLLLHKNEIKRLTGKVQMKGLTLIPLSLYFNEKNIIKIELALGKGKKLHDKRETEKQRDWQREKSAAIKDR